ncbi:glutathione peroxidase [Acanthopleuribacter pedis]|uniref:Glutathione peroxidase n=1 Tax=Acanthopleuribacter pedis TaxID=442870 RepID=A0A8J7PZ38_9BACT|nr:glutathione peroxidase [Acanthopleuribacter pedis]MBO1317332.1 glutathione peroxidase [Acanthopleuribacter pedis]MBO1318639.1 glutathione peroxidase [Acanthopleuribacter pedis]
MSDFYHLSANSLRGEALSFDQYKGKVVLVVNVASKCGLTPQYEGLEKLYQDFKDQGLVILGFPCNQFGGQEPGGVAEIEQTCRINYGVTFQMFEKIEVNGNGTHPVYKYLKKELPGMLGNGIKWNFTKFLVGADGKPIKRFAPTTAPKDLVRDIKKALEQAA